MRTFESITIGEWFSFDGHTLKKRGETFAWEYKQGKKWKLWAFHAYDGPVKAIDKPTNVSEV
jgi:hypothetical protein